MTETLTLPGEVYSKLVQGAARRGMTVEGLLTIVSDLVAEHHSDIDVLLGRFRTGALSAADRQSLEQLINADYEAANERADRMIRAKEHGRRPAKRSRK